MDDWNEDSVLQFIDMYRNNTVLWYPKDKDYYKMHIKEDAWQNIAKVIGKTADVCRKKLISLLASYRREKANEKTTGTGKGAKDVYSSRWFAYEAFQFLQDRDIPRKRRNTELLDSEDIGVNQGEGDRGIQDEVAQQPEPSNPPFHSPKPPKCAKRRQDDNNTSFVSEALLFMQDSAEKLNAPPSGSNENTCFGNYIVSKMNTYSPHTRKGVDHAIFEILVNADTGFYERPLQSGLPLYHGPAPQISQYHMQHGHHSYSTPSSSSTATGNAHSVQPFGCQPAQVPTEHQQNSRPSAHALQQLSTSDPSQSDSNSPSSQQSPFSVDFNEFL